nr:MAG TPA: hypothetical protein [Caudoviricetes sp.]
MPKGKTYTPASVGVFLFLALLTLQILHNVLSQLVLVGFVVVAELHEAVEFLMGYLEGYISVLAGKGAMVFAAVKLNFAHAAAVVICILVLKFLHTYFGLAVFLGEHVLVAGVAAFEVGPLVHLGELYADATYHAALVGHGIDMAILVTGKFAFQHRYAVFGA